MTHHTTPLTRFPNPGSGILGLNELAKKVVWVPTKFILQEKLKIILAQGPVLGMENTRLNHQLPLTNVTYTASVFSFLHRPVRSMTSNTTPASFEKRSLFSLCGYTAQNRS